jgi:hypothetical protein
MALPKSEGYFAILNELLSAFWSLDERNEEKAQQEFDILT